MDPAEAPAAVFAGNVETESVAGGCPARRLGVAAASQGTMNNFLWGNRTSNTTKRSRAGPVHGPSRRGQRGADTHDQLAVDRLEVLEWRFPVLLEEFSVRRGSGRAGERRGGDGVVRRLRFEQAMTATLLTGRRRTAPLRNAGRRGRGSRRNLLLRPGQTPTELPAVVSLPVYPGDAIQIETPGGGGFGAPPNDQRRGSRARNPKTDHHPLPIEGGSGWSCRSILPD
ncbi:MAG: hydantoinase B/oxoprolinase family protein [Planctomycetota bacterium]